MKCTWQGGWPAVNGGISGGESDREKERGGHTRRDKRGEKKRGERGIVVGRERTSQEERLRNSYTREEGKELERGGIVEGEEQEEREKERGERERERESERRREHR